MVDVVDLTYAAVEAEEVGYECIDVVNGEVSGHEVSLALCELSLEPGSDVGLAAIPDRLDDFTQNGNPDVFVDGRVVDVEVLEVLLGKAVPDECVSVHPAVADDLERDLVELVLVSSPNDLLREDEAGDDARVLDLLGDLGCDDGVLLDDDFAILRGNVLSRLLADDPSGETELLVDLEDAYALKVISE